MEMYLLKSGLCLAILFGFYKLFLENETMHVFKRFYLLGALVISFLIPFITFTTYVEIPLTTTPVIMNTDSFSVIEIEAHTNYWSFILWSLYGLGVLYFSLKFSKNLNQIFSRIRNNQKLKWKTITYVLLKNAIVPHTFLNYIFLNKEKYEAQEIPDEVLQHEHMHAKQKHSIDILVVEVLQILFWFNPFLYFIKGSIKLNHEFLADQAVLKQGVDTTAYQTLLLAFSSAATTPQLANSINYSFIKKRFTVMKKQTSTQAIWLRTLLILPLVAILVFGFSSKEVIQKEAITEQVHAELQQEKATKTEIEEYNKLAKKYNNMPNDAMKIDAEEVNRFSFLYQKMTLEQRKKAEPFPEVDGFPGPPPAPPVPQDSNLNKDSWVQDFDKSYQEINTTSSLKSIIFYINDDETFSINNIPSTKENYKTTLKGLFKKFENIKSEEEIKVYFKSENLVKWSFIQEIGEELKKYNIETISVSSGILVDRDENRITPPPVPPIPPTPNDLKLAKEIQEKGGEFYVNNKKISFNEFTNQLEQIKTSNQSYTINLEKGENGKDLLRITIQE